MKFKVYKITKDFVQISEEPEIIKYIKKTFDLSKPTVIMCHYIWQREMVHKLLPSALVVSSTSKAEGIDYSYAENFIILSSDYSGAKHIQRRERIININGSNTLKVIFLLVKSAISQQVYAATSKKLDFNNAMFKRVELS